MADHPFETELLTGTPSNYTELLAGTPPYDTEVLTGTPPEFIPTSTMPEPKEKRSPIKRIVKVFSRSSLRPSSSSGDNKKNNASDKTTTGIATKTPTTTMHTTTDSTTAAAAATEPQPSDDSTMGMDNSRMEDTYFQDPSSRENLSSNPGEKGKHMEERRNCTSDNWHAELDRRSANCDTIDFAYPVGDPRRRQSYGLGDGTI